MSEKEIACPECHYSTYQFYTKTDPPRVDIDPKTGKEIPIYERNEVPVAVKSVFGWLCRICRHEWKDDGNPVDPEKSRTHALKIRQHGKELHKKVLEPQNKTTKTRDRNEGFIPR